MTFSRILAAVAVAVALAMTGCITPASDKSAPSPASAQASGSFRTLDTAAFSELVSQPGTVALDVRTAGEYAEGHLADAVKH